MKKIVIENCGECPYEKEYKHKDGNTLDICTKLNLVIGTYDEIHDDCDLKEDD